MKLLKKFKILLVILLVMVGGGTFYYFKYYKPSQNNISQKQEITFKAQKGTLRDTVSASGQIQSANYLPINTSVNGIVKKVYVKEGDTVKKGQAIMEITLNSDGEQSLESVRSSYLSAKNSLEKAKTSLISAENNLINAKEAFTTEKEHNSYQNHDERIAFSLAENNQTIAQANYEIQQQSINQAQIAVNESWLNYQAQSPTILSPGDGVISNIVIVEGMDISNSLSVKTSAMVASIRTPGTPIALINISEVDINKIKVGQKAELTLASISNKTFEGEIVGLDKIGTSSSGVANYPVIIKFNEESESVLPNMGVDTDIIINEKPDAVYIPTSAISPVKGQKTVKIKDGDSFKNVNIETGISTTQYTEVISGVNEGEEVQVTTLPTSGFTNATEGTSRTGGAGIFPGAGGGTFRR